jgi:hypothetical protein
MNGTRMDKCKELESNKEERREEDTRYKKHGGKDASNTNINIKERKFKAPS